MLEPTVSKVRSLKSAFEAAVSLLRIDDAIQCVPGKFSCDNFVGYGRSCFTLQSKKQMMATDIRRNGRGSDILLVDTQK